MDNNQNGGYGNPQPQVGNPAGYGMPQAGGNPAGYGMPQAGGNPAGYGMPQAGGNPAGYGMPQTGGNQPPKKKKTGLVIGLVILVLALIGGGVFLFLKRSNDKKAEQQAKDAKATVEVFCDGMQNRDMDAMVEAYYPELQGNVESNFLLSNGVDTVEDFWAHYDFVFGGYSFDYELSDAEKVSDSKCKGVLKIVETTLNVKVETDTMYLVETEETYYGDNGQLVLNEKIYLVEKNGDWYILYAESTPVENTLTEPSTEDTTEEITTEETSEETTEDIATEETTEAIAVVPADGFDWDNMQFSMNGTMYNLSTLTYSDIQAMGYELDEEYLNEELEDNQYSMSALAKAADDSDMYVRFKNFTGGGTRKITECEILGITLSRDTYENFYEAGLGNGITFGMTVEQVKEIMGMETSYEYVSEDSDYVSIEYEENDDVYACGVTFTFSSGLLDEIELINYD